MGKNIWFWSDLHLGHENMYRFVNWDGSKVRPWEPEQMQEAEELMLQEYNKVVKPEDTCYWLGDVSGRNNIADKFFSRVVKSRRVLILGNHDNTLGVKFWLKHFDDVRGCYNLSQKGERTNYFLSHVPIHPASKGRFKRNIHGHCIDDLTEVLTVNGFKKFLEISKEDIILNLNTEKDIIEKDKIKDIISIQYTGNVYYFKSYGIDIRVTDKHRMLYKPYEYKSGNKYRFLYPEDFIQHSKKEFIRAGFQKESSIPLSDDLIRLLVWISADGNKANKDLIRFFLKKERKINRLKELLIRLNINFREIDRGEYTGVHFTCPKELINLRFKPIDPIILKANRNQASIIREEYSNTDGTKNSKNVIVIYTSKKEEVELLQRMFVINGFGSSIHTRMNHGFLLQNGSDKVSYELQVSSKCTRTPSNLKKITTISYTENEHFWCLDTYNGTLIIRRNGKVCITGNCHGELTPFMNKNKILKELDPWYRNVSVEVTGYKPVNFDEIVEETEKLIEDEVIIIPKKGERI